MVSPNYRISTSASFDQDLINFWKLTLSGLRVEKSLNFEIRICETML